MHMRSWPFHAPLSARPALAAATAAASATATAKATEKPPGAAVTKLRRTGRPYRCLPGTAGRRWGFPCTCASRRSMFLRPPGGHIWRSHPPDRA
eukprot:scaffold100898_cov63-Phaeocystis_antarctica.AAC.3